jgi:putative transposase
MWRRKYWNNIFECSEIRERAEHSIQEIREDYEIDMLELEISIEHIHLSISLPMSKSIEDVVRILKNSNAREMFRGHPVLQKLLWPRQIWKDGYFPMASDRMIRATVEDPTKNHRDITQGSA